MSETGTLQEHRSSHLNAPKTQEKRKRKENEQGVPMGPDIFRTHNELDSSQVPCLFSQGQPTSRGTEGSTMSVQRKPSNKKQTKKRDKKEKETPTNERP